MKPVSRIFLFIILISCAIKVKAADFYLRMYDNSAFTIIFNQSYPVYGCRFFQANNLAAGNYSIEVYNTCNNINTPCMLPLYRGTVSIPASGKIMSYLNMNNRLQTGGIIPSTSYSSNGYNPNNSNDLRRHYSMGWNNLNDSAGYAKAQKAMTEISGTALKLSYLKHCIYFYGIRTEKLSELMKYFSFDNERLDLAIFSYSFTSDIENYYTVYDALIFSGSKLQLDNYLFNHNNYLQY
jgi:hypothetical protein